MEKKVYFILHKVKKQWVTIAVTGLALGLSFASLGDRKSTRLNSSH